MEVEKNFNQRDLQNEVQSLIKKIVDSKFDLWVYVVVSSFDDRKQYTGSIDQLLQKYIIDGESLSIHLPFMISPFEVLRYLHLLKPQYCCFVTSPEQCDKKFVEATNLLSRSITNSIFSDFFWGILTTSCDEKMSEIILAGGLRQLLIKTVFSGTKINLQVFQKGICYSQMVENERWIQQEGQQMEKLGWKELTTEADNTNLICENLNSNQFDLVVTSGHARETEWNIGFGFQSGVLTQTKNVMRGVNQEQKEFEIKTSNPKVYVACGNCLMGHIQYPQCMALAWMESCSVLQMVGYTRPTWFGWAGWGINKYFIELAGLYSLNQSYFANTQTILHQIDLIEKTNIKDLDFYLGLQYDRDSFVFYGDPAFNSSIQCEKSKLPIQKEIFISQDHQTGLRKYRIEIICLQDGVWDTTTPDDHFTIIARPPIFFLPRISDDVTIIQGDIMVSRWFVYFKLDGEFKKGTKIQAEFWENSHYKDSYQSYLSQVD